MQTEEKYRACVGALKAYADNAGFTDIVIGLSGGIDSSLVTVMCVDAFGADHVHGVLLPGPYSTSHSVDDAQDLANGLGIDVCTVSICEPYEAFEHVLKDACGGDLAGLAAENTQARCRTVCIMALSNRYNWMMVNTGNKSEAMMGYSTLYGDTAGAFAPVGGLYKTDVYALANWRNEAAATAGKDLPIPQHVLVKPPSAELSPEQKDETSMGIDYATLDELLIAHNERGLSAEELVAEGFEASTVKRILATITATAFKRAQEPPYPDAPFYA